MKLGEDPQIRAHVEVMWPPVAPNVNSLDAVEEVVLLHELLPSACDKVNVILDAFCSDKVKVNLPQLVLFLRIESDEDKDEILDKSLLESQLGEISEDDQNVGCPTSNNPLELKVASGLLVTMELMMMEIRKMNYKSLKKRIYIPHGDGTSVECRGLSVGPWPLCRVDRTQGS